MKIHLIVIEILLGIIGLILYYLCSIFCLDIKNSAGGYKPLRLRINHLLKRYTARNKTTDGFYLILLISVVSLVIYIQKKYSQEFDTIYGDVYLILICFLVFHYVIDPILVLIKKYKSRRNI